MKNKGRRHKAGYNEELSCIANTKSILVVVTRPVRSMSSKGHAFNKYLKKKWIKRMRGYSKSQTKEV